MEKQTCPLCERAMNENKSYHRCKHDNVVVWKDTSKEGTQGKLDKNVHVELNWFERQSVKVTKILGFIFHKLSVMFYDYSEMRRRGL